MKKLFLRTGAAVLAVLALAACADLALYDRQAWIADYKHLKRDMAQGYANLDWMVQAGRVDLRALDRDTTARLQASVSHVQGFMAIRDFVRAFRDPHLRMAWGQRPASSVVRSTWHLPRAAGGADAEPAAAEQAVEDCGQGGYEEGKHGFALPFERLPGWRTVAASPFPAGVAGETGVLRIAQFGEDSYLAACQAVFKPGLGARVLQLRVRQHLQGQLEGTLRALRAAGARKLVVDVSGNGGGTEWVEDVVALFAGRTLSREASRAAAPSCDRSRIWDGTAVCPVLAPSGEDVTLQGRGLWTGPLYVASNRGTGSAAEDFVAWLKENRVAVVLGEPTAGAGCGYVDGGHRSVLLASRFDVRMPNCARYLRDGSNEVAGIAPDRPLALDEESFIPALAAVLRDG